MILPYLCNQPPFSQDLFDQTPLGNVENKSRGEGGCYARTGKFLRCLSWLYRQRLKLDMICFQHFCRDSQTLYIFARSKRKYVATFLFLLYLQEIFENLFNCLTNSSFISQIFMRDFQYLTHPCPPLKIVDAAMILLIFCDFLVI